MGRTVLIVDDVEINRRMLRKILSQDYDILEAENGEEALSILNKAYKYLSAVLLDIIMPVMDGYAVLEQMQKNPMFSQIPVIVTTANSDGDAEMRALSLGANDYITKPYVPGIIKRRLQNTINLRETAAAVNALQRDKLTKLNNREAFFQKAGDMIATRPAGYYVMACFDIDNFKVINDQYGTAKGDEVLRRVAAIFKDGFSAHGGMVGRITADNFAVLYPASLLDSAVLARMRHDASVLDGSIPPISFSIGRYVISDLSLPVSAMYDRAAIAESSIKGRFDVNIAHYDESMRDHILRQQEIVNEMKQALEDHQFHVWLQPQYNHSTGALVGAEALVRWVHPQKGIISPGEFIPVFEKNGFVYELDKFVWEQTCILLRKWLDEGNTPLPVSVNVSRYDVFRGDLLYVITSLVEKYNIPIDLLRLEITESAFAKSTQQIINVVKSLIDYGFTMEIDDFGSGYSSLNTLKDVPAQIVKLDMRFLEGDENTDRGGNILESVVRMAKWLGMSVIAEGVETAAQADYLKSIGCNYVQGYLYARPMPAAEYEALSQRADAEEKLITMETVENLNNNSFWNPESMDTLIFNSYVGGACIFEYHNGNIELLRATDKYAQVLGSAGLTVEDALRLDWSQHLDEESRRVVQEAVERSLTTRDEVTSEYMFHDLPGCPEKTYLRSTIRVIASTGNRYLIYCTNENITLERELEEKERHSAQQLQAIMDNINGGVTVIVMEEDRPKILFANEQFYALLGLSREQYEQEIANPHELIHPEDRQRVARETAQAALTDQPFSTIYRIRRPDGSIRWLQSNVTVMRLPGVASPVQLAVENDITALREAEQREREMAERLQAVMENVNNGITAVTTRGEEVIYLFTNDRYYEMLGYTREQYHAEVVNTYELIHPEDRQWVYDEVEKINASGQPAVLEYRVIRRDGKVIWERNSISVTRFAGIDAPVQLGVCTDVTKEKEAELRILALNENLGEMMNDIPGGFVRLKVLPEGGLAAEYVNESFSRLRGMSSGHALQSGFDAMSAIHPDDVEMIKSTVAEMISTGKTCNIHYRLQHQDGHYIPVNVFGRVSANEAGETFINIYYTDLTEAQKKDLTLRETIPYVFSAIMQYSTDLVFAKDKDYRYICCSPAFVKFTRQQSEQDVIGKTDYDFWTKEEADHFRGDDRRLFESGEPLIDYIEPIPSDDGIQHYCSTSKYLLRDSTGEIIGMYGIGRDITEQKATAEQLRVLTDNIPGGLATYAYSAEGLRLIYFNDGLCKMMGYTRQEYEELAKKNPITAVFEEDIPRLQAQIQRMIEDGVPVDCTYRVHKPKGEGYKWVNLRVSEAERRGEAMIANAVLFDVTEQKRAEEAARIHEQEMELAMSQLGKMLCEYDPATRQFIVPQSYVEKYNLNKTIYSNIPDSVIAANLIDEDSVPAFREFYDAIHRGEKTGSVEYLIRRSDGALHWERGEFSSIFDSSGQPVKTIISLEETTEQHQKFELEQKRPMLGEANLLGNALFNLTTGETLDYVYHDGNDVPAHERLAFILEGDNLEQLLINEEERTRYRELHDREHLLARFEQGESELSFDYRRRMPDGEIIWARNILHMLEEPGGGNVLLFEYCYSIETEKTMEMISRSLIRFNYDFIIRLNAATHRYVLLKRSQNHPDMSTIVGKDIDLTTREEVAKRVHPDDWEMVLENSLVLGLKRKLEQEEPCQFTYRYICSDGSLRYKRITAYYMDRERDIIIVTREDVTGLMREEIEKNQLLEAALQAANEESLVKERAAAEQLSLILNNVKGGMSATAHVQGKLHYIFTNDEFYSILGYTKEQFHQELSMGIFDIIHPDDLERVKQTVLSIEETGSGTADFRIFRRDGRMIWVRNNGSICRLSGVDAPVHVVYGSDITSEREAADNLRMSEEQFRVAASIGGWQMARYDIKNCVYYHENPDLLAMGFDKKVENAPWAFVEAGNILPEFVGEYLEFFDKIRQGEESATLDSRFLMADGSFRWTRQDATVIFDADGQPSQAIIVLNDITDLREKEAVYKRWQQSLEEKLPASYTLVRSNLTKDSAAPDSTEGSLLKVRFSNEATSFNKRTQEYAERLVHPEDREAYMSFANSENLLSRYYQGLRREALDYREMTSQDSCRWLRLTIELVEYPYSSDIEAYLMYEDIDKPKREELRNKELAETDPLTGVLNRTAFYQAVEHLIKDAQGTASLALLMLDVDDFKLINDTFGHAMGDRVLVDISNSLKSVLRPGDLLGRFGGDEFLICLKDVGDEEAIGRKAAQICAMLHKALSLEIYTSASIGIALYPRDGEDFEVLYRKVDTALYIVKDHGKNNYAFFREGMEEEYATLGASNGSQVISSLDAQKIKRRMLIVDDNQLNLVMLAKLFEDEFNIETARGGGEALSSLRRYGQSIAVVLLDLVMPGLDGFAVLEKMRASAELRTIPVIVVSGLDEHETSLRTIRSGAADFVTKPVDPDLLRLRVQSVISKTENERLRGQNSILLMHNTEIDKYRAALESAGAVIIEYEPDSQVFFYDAAVSGYIDGSFDNRPLWDILASDQGVPAGEVERLRRYTEEAAAGGEGESAAMNLSLRTPSQEQQLFKVCVKKRDKVPDLPKRVMLTFIRLV